MFFPEDHNPPGNGNTGNGAATPKYLLSSPSLPPTLDPPATVPPHPAELLDEHGHRSMRGSGLRAAVTSASSIMSTQTDVASVYNVDPADELRQLTSPGGVTAAGISAAINMSAPRLQLDGHDLPASLPHNRGYGKGVPSMLEDNTPFPDNARLSDFNLAEASNESLGSAADLLGLKQLAASSDNQLKTDQAKVKAALGPEISIEVGMGDTFRTNLLGYSSRPGDLYTIEDKKQPISSDSSAFKVCQGALVEAGSYHVFSYRNASFSTPTKVVPSKLNPSSP